MTRVASEDASAARVRIGPVGQKSATGIKRHGTGRRTLPPMKPDTRSFYEQAVLHAAERVARSLDDALDLEALAGAVNLSPFHFHRIFRGMLGETPLELHRRLRLERAAWALCTGTDSVSRIAFDAGYETHEAFTRAFRAHYGHAPATFRGLAVVRPEGCVRPAQTELAARSGLHFSPGAPGRVTLPLFAEDHRMHVTVVERPQMRVAACRHLGAYSRISDAFARLHARAVPAGLLREGAEMLAIYHDDPETTAEAALRSDAALSVPPDAPIPNGLTELTIPAGHYAVATHVGPYEQLGDAWTRLMGEWLPRSGFRVGSGVSYELYHNNPTNAAPAELRTEMFVPVVAEAEARATVGR